MCIDEINDTYNCIFFFFQAEDGIRDYKVTGVQTCALPISRRIDYAEINPALIGVGKKYAVDFDDPLIHVYNKDGRRFLGETDQRYDVVIINLPEPSTIQINRYY